MQMGDVSSYTGISRDRVRRAFQSAVAKIVDANNRRWMEVYAVGNDEISAQVRD